MRSSAVRRIRRLSRRLVAFVLSLSLAAGTISCGPPALGLQDYQRDLLFGVLGALADALLIQVATGGGDDSALDAPGPAGARGPDQFSVQVEDFFGAQFDDNFAATPMALDAAILAEGAGPIGFRAPIPLTYGTNGVRRAVNLRLVFVRSGPCDGTCTSFTIDTRCLETGSSAPICFGGEAADCADGRRWIQLPEICTTGDEVGGFIVVDLPLDARGLMLPTPGPGDFLAFELNAVVTDAGSYRLVGAELYDADGVAPRNASIFARAEDVPDSCRAMTGSDFDGDMVPDDDTDVSGRQDSDDDDDGLPDDDEGDGDDDNDGDGDPDSLDIDSDNDGIVDLVEIQGHGPAFIAPSGNDADDDGLDDAYDADQGGTTLVPVDTDGDGIPDMLDLDADGDLVPDRTEGHDANMDGQPDAVFSGNDMDTDGLDDVYDTVMRPMMGNSLGSNAPLQDTDGDGTPDWRDPDDDGDGIPTEDEDRDGDGDPTNDDSDGDGTPDYLDPDDDFDGDGVPDPDDADDDDDGIPDEDEGDGDDDGDGQPNALDIDRDNDGIVDLVEAQPRGPGFVAPSGNDADKDGLDDAYDPDQGGTPLSPIDTDGDGTPDVDDLDTDNDTVPDSIEGHDANMDGQPDVTPTGNDADRDGLDDAYDTVTRPQPGNSAGSNAPLQDTDGDGTPDWRDTDDDGDGIPTKDEDINGNGDPTDDDSDGDGTPDYLDPIEDCNDNGIDDSVDLANGTEEDCNENDIPDSCDIASGTSVDDNGNMVPDECEMMGACCFEDDTCVLATEIVCVTKLGGEFLGAGSECAGNKGLLATYYDNMDFTGNAVTRVDTQIDFNWGSGGPAAGIGANTFSAVWEGYLLPPATGLYTLYISNDDGMRVYVDGQLVVDRWVDQAVRETSGTVMLTGGTSVPIRVEYYENSGSAVARLRWSSDQFGKETIPPAALSNGQVGYCPTSIGACCMPDGSCEELPAQLCLDNGGMYLGDGTTCQQPPAWRTESGSYRLGNGPSYPQGGMVLYNFLNTSGATWFDFDAEGAAMFMTYDADAGTVRVSGYAAATVSGLSGFAFIDMPYADVQQVDGELRVTTPNGSNNGTVLWLPTGQVAELADKQLSGATFRFYDAGGYDKGTGWFMHGCGTGDFHFEAERDPYCEPDPVGACCLEDGACAGATEWLCNDVLHGSYAGDDTTCQDACTPPCEDILEDFENGDGGWTCENASNCGIEEDMGNPGDSYGGCDDNGETAIIAGPKFLGDLRGHDGGQFGFDLLVFKSEEVESRMGKVYIETPAGTFVQDIIPTFTPQARVYNTFSGSFTAAAFGTDQATWEAGLANVTRIRIVIEPGWDCWCVDNVLLTCPAP